MKEASELISLLQQIESHLSESSINEFIDGEQVLAIKTEILQYIQELKEGNFENLDSINFLFAPTGPLQDFFIFIGKDDLFLITANAAENSINQIK